MMSKIDRVFTLDDEMQYCYNLEHTYPVPPTQILKMFVPKLMTEISFSTIGKSSLVKFAGHNAVYINDPACRPSCAKSFNTLNYIPIPLLHNMCSWGHIPVDIHGHISSHTQFQCHFLNREVIRYYFTTNLP